jgi:hypothetical protein
VLQKTALLTSGILTGLMLTSAASHADSYYTPSSKDYGRDSIGKTAKQSCKSEIRDQIRSDRRNVQKVKFNGNTIETLNTSRREITVNGQGHLLTGRNHWVKFDFHCIYNHHNDRVTRASYLKTSNNWNQPDDNQETRQACKREIDNRILDNHGSASHIKFDDGGLRRWQESVAEVGLSGHGRFIGGKGRNRHFEFSCLYNHRQGYMRNAWVSVD